MREPTQTEAAFLESIAVRATLPAETSAACMDARWVEAVRGIHWRLTEAGHDALARYREAHAESEARSDA